jgi:hypothetical protein
MQVIRERLLLDRTPRQPERCRTRGAADRIHPPTFFRMTAAAARCGIDLEPSTAPYEFIFVAGFPERSMNSQTSQAGVALPSGTDVVQQRGQR